MDRLPAFPDRCNGWHRPVCPVLAPWLPDFLSHRHHRAAEFLGFLLAVDMLDPEADFGRQPVVLETDKDEPVIPKPGKPRLLDPGADTEDFGRRNEETPALTLPDFDAVISDKPLCRQQVVRLRIVGVAAHIDAWDNTTDIEIRLLLPSFRFRPLPPQHIAKEVIHRLTIFLTSLGSNHAVSTSACRAGFDGRRRTIVPPGL